MSVLRKNTSNVTAFEFGKLVPSETPNSEELESFELEALSDASSFKHNITEDVIRLEREFEAASSFNIDEVIKEHRGLNRQAEEDYQNAVAQEVERRVSALEKEAYEKGFEKGLAEGHEKAYTEAKVEFDHKLDECANRIEQIQTDSLEILSKAKDDAYRMVKNLTKWVILKEVDEKYYLARLLEKLIHEINSKSNLVLHVNQDSFGYIPEVIKIVERKVGRLTNVRVESDLDMKFNGIKLESENTVIDGSLEAQFETIDRLFQNVGLNE